MRDKVTQGKTISTKKQNIFFQGGETFSMKTRKLLASVLAFAMLLSLVAIPAGSASAATTYSAVDVPQVSKDKASVATGTLRITLDPILVDSEVLIKFNNVKNVTAGIISVTDEVSTAGATQFSAKEVRLTATASGTVGKGEIYVPFTVNTTDSSDGEIVATLTPLSGNFAAGSVVLATIGSGTSNVTIDSVDHIAGTTNNITIRVTENRLGAIANKTDGLKLELPTGFEFTNIAATNVVGDAVFNSPITTFTSDNRVATIQTTAGNIKTITDITLTVAVNDLKAKHGDVVVKISGGNKYDVSELTIAKYADFGVTLSAKESKKLVAGTSAKEVGAIVIEETAPGSVPAARTLYLTLPVGLKWSNWSDSNFGGSLNIDQVGNDTTTSASALTNSGRTLRLQSGAATGTAEKAELKGLKVDIAPDFKGDVAVEVSGNAGISGSVVVATVAAPVTITAEKADVVLGIQGQTAGNIVIEEGAAGRLKVDDTIKFEYELTGVRFQNKPTVKVLEGDIEVSIKKVDATSSVKEHLELKVTKESNTKAKIEISNIGIIVDRYAAYGDNTLNAYGLTAAQVTSRFADNKFLAKVANINVVGEAAGEVVAESKFVIDAKTYTVGGVEKVMDVAPFIQDGRTMLPVRFVAEALGVSEDNIIWNAVTKQVTIMKGDRIAQLTIGSDVMLVNGVSMTMDTKAAVKDGRTVLPVRFVAQALNANIAWDDATRTVTVN